MESDYFKGLNPGDVVWFTGPGISHQALIVDINVADNTVKIAGEVASHGIEDGAVETYDLERWAPSLPALNAVYPDWSDEKKERIFGLTEVGDD